MGHLVYKNIYISIYIYNKYVPADLWCLAVCLSGVDIVKMREKCGKIKNAGKCGKITKFRKIAGKRKMREKLRKNQKCGKIAGKFEMRENCGNIQNAG